MLLRLAFRSRFILDLLVQNAKKTECQLDSNARTHRRRRHSVRMKRPPFPAPSKGIVKDSEYPATNKGTMQLPVAATLPRPPPPTDLWDDYSMQLVS